MVSAQKLPERYNALANKKLLVTGAAGFIGYALLQRLAGYGLDVVGTVLYSEEVENLQNQGFKVQQLDLASEEPFEPYLEGIDYVFNIAAMFQETEHGEALYDKVNNLGALKLCKAATHSGVSSFLQCSTVGVHGHVQEIPCSESSPFNPMDLYHRTKLAGELAILDFAKSLPDNGMVVTVNRPAMVYGPGDKRMFKLFKAIAADRFVMIGSGKVLTHLGYIEDQVDSFLQQVVAPREKVHLEAFNIASAEPETLQHIAHQIAHAAGVRPYRWSVPVAPVWLAGLACEILWYPFKARPPLFRRRVGFFTHDRAFQLTKARDHFGYESQWPHAKGIAATIEWYRNNGML